MQTYFDTKHIVQGTELTCLRGTFSAVLSFRRRSDVQLFLLELAYPKCNKECIHECMDFVGGIVPNDAKKRIDAFGFDKFGKDSIVWEHFW